MPRRVISILKEYKEILILLAAIGGVSVVAPRREPSATLQSIAAQLEKLNGKIEAIARVQCATTDEKQLALAGVTCNERTK